MSMGPAGMESAALFCLLRILLMSHYLSPTVDGATSTPCSLPTTKDVHTTNSKACISPSFDEAAVTPCSLPGTKDADSTNSKEINGRSGSFFSPGYPRTYQPDSEYLWKISVPENYDIVLQFKSFELESDEQCIHDYVEVRDGHEQDSPVLGKLCGSFNNIIRSSGNKMSVKFVTDGSVQKSGFLAKFKAGSCRTEIRSTQGIFHSTNYPQEYLPLTQCTWKIVAPENHYIILKFRSFQVENDEQCAYDYLEIRDGPSMENTSLGRFCGKNVTEHVQLFSTSNIITAKFVTDGCVQESGFEAEFMTVVCGGDITANKGQISSPNYLGKYLPDQDCVWTIAAPKGRPVLLKFKSFELDKRDNCAEDYVEIRDGTMSNSGQIVQFCGRDVPEYIISTGSNLSIRFVSNGQVEKAGFLAEYNHEFFVRSLSSESGEIQNPDYPCGYQPNGECVWRITVPDGSQIALHFRELWVDSSDQCNFDYVAVYDSDGLKSSLLGKFCGQEAPEDAILSSGNTMVVKFVTVGSTEKSRFITNYTTVSCGPLVLDVTDDLQIFSSPGYPSLYPPDMTCSWNFHITKPLYKVKIHFTDIDIPCADDSYLEISTPKEVDLPYRVCRNISTHLRNVISTGDVTMTFHSGSSGRGRGFRLEYVIADCQLNYTEDNGLILSPKYPYPYLPHWRCATTIDTSPNRTISLYFGSFQVGTKDIDPQCKHGWLKVYDGEAHPESLLATLCGSFIPSPIFSTGNRIIMVMRTYDNADALFSISYTTTDKGRGCGGLLSSTNGTFTSPMYPQVYKEPSVCFWYMSVPSFHSMTFNFSFFEVMPLVGCANNYVELYEGHAEILHKRVFSRCGRTAPPTYRSQSNELMLKLFTDSTNRGSGFVAHFQMNP